jgi:cation diffusion facilitator family transporter
MMQELNELKRKTARLSVFSNVSLVVLKGLVGLLLGSVSIVSEALHSGMDLIAAVIAMYSVRRSAEPPDEEHLYGHGKFEDFSGLIEALLIFGAAILILREAFVKILTPGEGLLEGNLLLVGIFLMGLSALINWLVSSRLMKVAHLSESIALESDAWHLRTDVYTSLGVFSGLILIRLTGIAILDPLFAIGVAIIIMRTAYELTRRSFQNLIDYRITDRELDRIQMIICDHMAEYVNFHNLKTRRSGPEIFIEFHMVMDGRTSVEQSHDLTDHLEKDLKVEFPRAQVIIHIEPAGEKESYGEPFCPVNPNKKE